MITRSMIEETADDATLDDEPVDSTNTCFGLDPADFDNHGEFVSTVARDEPGFEDIEQRDAAQSSCGKDDDDDDDDDDDEVEVKDERRRQRRRQRRRR